MTVVIDIGAARYGGDYSIERLIEQFEPTDLYAVDANRALANSAPKDAGNCRIHLTYAAAWIFDGKVGFYPDGLNGWVSDLVDHAKVRCIDTARFIAEVAERHDDRLVMKIDAEASEYEILPHVIAQDADELLDLLIVEWHERKAPGLMHEGEELMRRQRIRREVIEGLACEYQEWPY